MKYPKLFVEIHDLIRRNRQRTLLAAMAMVLITLPASSAFAETPWEHAFRVVSESVNGPIAHAACLIAVVVGGIGYAMDGFENKRVLAGIILGCGMALGAAQILTWLFV